MPTKSQQAIADPNLYINRELSWIEFNSRVLEEAQDTNYPLLERLKFVSIFSSNLDEFFMIRVAGLKEQLDAGVVNLAADGMSAEEQLREIRKRLLPLIEKQTSILKDDILPKLAEESVILHDYKALGPRDRGYLSDYFLKYIFPLLTPLAIDSGHPFPQLMARTSVILFVVSKTSESVERREIAVLQLPPAIQRFVPLSRKSGYHFVLLEQVIQAHAELLFPELTIHESYLFRVTRDADLEIAEDEAGDLLTEIEEKIRKRNWGDAVRLEVDAAMPTYLVDELLETLDLTHDDVYAINGPLNLVRFMDLTKLDIRSLRFQPFSTRVPKEFLVEGNTLFATLRQKDVLVHHPFDSFSNTVVKFLNTAAKDPNVLAIKMTLYRAGGNSPVIKNLKLAAENGKHVVALVELKARFDEENNIIWARDLEAAGVHVVYGLVGLKTHAKILMVIRKEEDKIRTYLHLGTGNYNQTTARLYTDFGYFTAREEFSNDAIHLFNYLTGYSQFQQWKTFAVAPLTLFDKIIELIRKVADSHTPESPGLIVVKINSITDPKVITELYRASQKGVTIRMIVRGICELRPGIAGMSENIEVRSILGRFLEHTRALYCRIAGQEEVYITSADWMQRNLYRRVELLFPILDEDAKKEIKDALELYWNDNTKARRLNSDGTYTPLVPGKEKSVIAQELLLAAKTGKARLPEKSKRSRDN